MPIPESFQKDLASMPPALKQLLEAELAAGNTITEVGHSFPAAPAGAYFLLAKPLQSRAQESGDGIVYYDRKMPSYSGEITDAKRHFFLLEPPHPPEPEPDMDAIRAAHQPKPTPPAQKATAKKPKAAAKAAAKAAPSPDPAPTPKAPATPLEQFEASMVMDFDKWHDGIGYDLDILRTLSAADQATVVRKLQQNGIKDWRDVEALAAIDLPTAKEALRNAMKSPHVEIRNAVTRYATDLVPDDARTDSLVRSLEKAVPFGGLSETLDQVAEYHPPEVVDTLFEGALKRDGEAAVHFAAMLCFLHGKAKEPFDWDLRPFFLRFHATGHDRETVFRELCEKVGVDPAKWFKARRSS